MKIEYLLFNIIIFFSACIGVSFYRGARWPSVRTYGFGVLFLSLPYLVWDHFVTDLWWSFNPSFTLGFSIGKLPIEEVLFFFVVPWSCLVIWSNLQQIVKGRIHFPIEYPVLALCSLLGMAAFLYQYWYATMVIVVAAIVTIASLLTSQVLRTKAYVVFLGFVSLMTLIFNSYLTARPVVTYAADAIIGLRIGTIPIEDFVYGIALLTGFVVIDRGWALKKSEQKDE